MVLRVAAERFPAVSVLMSLLRPVGILRQWPTDVQSAVTAPFAPGALY